MGMMSGAMARPVLQALVAPDQEAYPADAAAARPLAVCLNVANSGAGLCELHHTSDGDMATDSETVAVQREGAEMTDILNAEVQRRLHEENQKAIEQLRERIDLLIEQNETQTQALRIIIGSSVSDTEALLRFRGMQDRLLAYDKRISGATETIAAWVLRLFFAGVVAVMIFGLAVAGIGDAIRALLKG